MLKQEGEKKSRVNNQAFLAYNEVITLYVFYNGNQRSLLGIKYLNILQSLYLMLATILSVFKAASVKAFFRFNLV